jgi:hypothetical protein
MTDIEARVADLIKFSSNQKPIDFEDAFRAVIHDKVTSAIEAKKQEIAMNMFNSPSDEADLDSEEETDNEDIEVEDQEDGETA